MKLRLPLSPRQAHAVDVLLTSAIDGEVRDLLAWTRERLGDARHGGAAPDAAAARGRGGLAGWLRQGVARAARCFDARARAEEDGLPRVVAEEPSADGEEPRVVEDD